MKRTAATVIAIAALAAPSSAFAAPIMATAIPSTKSSQDVTTTGRSPLNEQSDRRALVAYANYLTALVAQEPAGQAYDNSYIATISQSGTGGCKAALSKLTQPPYQVDAKAQHTLMVLGEEIGDDVTINFDLSATEPFTKFSTVLKALRWTRLSGAGLVIRHYISSEVNLLALASSNLCLDASYAQLHPDVVPDSTSLFVQTYNRTASQANYALVSLTALMETYEIPGEKTLVTRISTLASQLSTQTKTDLLQSGTTLTNVLESD